MTVTNPSALNFVTEYYLDQIIGITSGTLSVAAPSGFVNTTASADFAHGFGDSAYFQGIFTSDGGTTWNDFGSMIPATVAGNLVFQTVGCNATCSTTNLTTTLTSYVTNFGTGMGSAATISYKVYLLAKNTMASPLTPLATNQILQYNTAFNYQKIFMKGTSALSVSAGATGSVSTIHNLGYVPKVRAFRLDSGAPTTVLPIANGTVADPRIQIDTTTLTFYSDCSNVGTPLNTSIEWRIYLDS